MDNFTAIRNGLLDHIRDGKLCPFDLGIYLFLHLTEDWETGICFTNARAIAVQFGGRVNAKDVRQSLYRLRERRYVNYRDGDGSRGCYDVLLHKSRPTVGRHVGKQLNAFVAGSLGVPVYESHNSDATVKSVSANTTPTVVSPIQDLKTLQDVQDKSQGTLAPSPSQVKRASQMPGDFVPNESHQKLAAELVVDLATEFEVFKDHHLAHGSTFKNWDSALNKWLRNAREFRRGFSGNGKMGTVKQVSAVEQMRRFM